MREFPFRPSLLLCRIGVGSNLFMGSHSPPSAFRPRLSGSLHLYGLDFVPSYFIISLPKFFRRVVRSDRDSVLLLLARRSYLRLA